VTGWLLRRVGQAALVVLAMTLIVFVGLHSIGNPADILIGEDLNQQERLAAIARLGLDQPLWKQYLLFLDGAMHGTLGRSFVYQEDAVRLILQRLPATLELAVSALLMAVVLGVPFGLYAGMKPDHWLSKTLMATSIVGFSLPAFWVALMLIMVFAVQLGWLPASGRGETVTVFGVPWSCSDAGRPAPPAAAGLQPGAVQDRWSCA
jgi:peptide/nickel transport system permease protein